MGNCKHCDLGDILNTATGEHRIAAVDYEVGGADAPRHYFRNEPCKNFVFELECLRRQNAALLEAARYAVDACLNNEPMIYPMAKLRAAIELARNGDK